MPRMDRVPGQDTRLRRALEGLGSDFVPYERAIKDVDLGAFDLTTTGLGTFGNLDVDTLNFNGNVISDSDGTISFDNDNLITTGIGTFAGLTVVNAVTEFSTDGTLGGDSDSALPTEKAVKTYVDTLLTGSYVPYSGANANVDLGAYTLDASDVNITDEAGGYQIDGTRILSDEGTDNIWVGEGTGSSITTGNKNVAIGIDAGLDLTEGTDNILIGYHAGYELITGGDNCLIGNYAGLNCTGDENTVIGSLAAWQATSASENTVLGYGAGYALTNGTGNTLIGYNAGTILATGDYNIAIGRNISLAAAAEGAIAIGSGIVASASNQLVIGSSIYGITDAYIGWGTRKATAAATTLQTTGGLGTNNVGADFILAAGKSTGNATPPVLKFQTSTAGASSEALQSLATRMTISGSLIDCEDLDITTTGDLTVGENNGLHIVSNYSGANNTRIGLNKNVDSANILFDVESITNEDATFKFNASGGGNAYMWLKGNTQNKELAFRAEDESGNAVFEIRNTRYNDGYNGNRHDDLLISSERTNKSILFRTNGTIRAEIDENGSTFLGNYPFTNSAEFSNAGDLTWNGTAGDVTGETRFQSNVIIDTTAVEAFLVRQDADAADVFCVDTTNNRVGMGTAAPEAPFELRRATGAYYLLNQTNGEEFISLLAGGTGSGIRVSDTNRFFIGFDTYAGRNNTTFGSPEALSILSTGATGINTNTPDAKLQVVGDCKFGDDNTNYASFATDGELTLVGTARTTNALWLGAQALKAPGVKPATFVDHGISGAWQFTNGTDDTIVAVMRIPNRMDRTVAPTFSIGWSSTAASLVGIWQLEYLWRAANEDTTVAADATLTNNATSSATAEGMVTTTFTLVAPSATDVCLHVRIKRRADLVADTLAVDAELHGMCLNFTSNKLGTAT